MSTINDNDLLLVNRGSTSYNVKVNEMSTLEDTDLLLINRGGVSYQMEAKDLPSGTGAQEPILSSVVIYDANPEVTNRFTDKDYGTIPEYSQTGIPEPQISIKGKVQGDLGHIPITDNIITVTPAATVFTPAQQDHGVYIPQPVDGNPAHFNRFNSSTGSRTTMTFSWWQKGYVTVSQAQVVNYQVANVDGDHRGAISYGSDGTLSFGCMEDGTWVNGVTTTASIGVKEDPMAWVHVVVIYDSTETDADDRVQIWVNGVRETVSINTACAENQEISLNDQAVQVTIGQYSPNGGGGSYNLNSQLSAYISSFIFIDGMNVPASEFGATNSLGQWVPKTYTGAYGENGYNIPFDPDLGSSDTMHSTNLSECYNPSGAFKGGPSTNYLDNTYIDGDNVEIVWTPPNSIPYTSSVEVYTTMWPGDPYFGAFTLNNGTPVAVVNQDWTTVATGSGTISTLKVSSTTGGANIGAIRVDGVLITDPAGICTDSSGNKNNLTPTNLPAGNSSKDWVAITSTSGGWAGGTVSPDDLANFYAGLNSGTQGLWVSGTSNGNSPNDPATITFNHHQLNYLKHF